MFTEAVAPGLLLLIGRLAAVPVSFLHYPYPLVRPCLYLEQLRPASMADIGCLKVIAISRQAEKKDFFDLMAVWQRLAVAELKSLLLAKYGARRLNFYHILKSLLYCGEAEASPDPVSLTGTTWEEVKSFFLSREKELWQELCLRQ